MNRRVVAIVLVVVALLVIAAGALVYFALNAPPSTSTTPGGTPVVTTIVGRGCGITKTSTGYTFSWLHVANGDMVDDKNCIVDLKGFNWSQLEFGNAVGGFGRTRISDQGIAWFNQTFHMNLWRIPINSFWWKDNIAVPLAGMNYRDWIQQVVRWAEQNGDYVVLTGGTHFHNPPCAVMNSTCPTQNQGIKNRSLMNPNDPVFQEEQKSVDLATGLWTDISTIYANDPAVLYNPWNELNESDAQTWWNKENTLINIVRAHNPHSLVFLGGPKFNNNINPLIDGTVPNFTQPNLVMDFHVYNGFSGVYNGKNCVAPRSYVWTDWPGHADEQVGFAQRRGYAVAINEWGGCNDFDQYNSSLTSYARSHHICMAYYEVSNVFDQVNGQDQPNENGRRVQQAYATW